MLYVHSLRTTAERSWSGSININFLTKQGYPISDKNSQFAEKTEKIKWEERKGGGEGSKKKCEIIRGEGQREDRGDSLMQTAQRDVLMSYSPFDIAVYRNTLEVTLYPAILARFFLCWLLYQLSHSPGHHLLLLVGGMPTTADWMDCCGQEVQSVVFKVLIHQWQDDLRVKSHGYMLKKSKLWTKTTLLFFINTRHSVNTILI